MRVKISQERTYSCCPVTFVTVPPSFKVILGMGAGASPSPLLGDMLGVPPILIFKEGVFPSFSRDLSRSLCFFLSFLCFL